MLVEVLMYIFIFTPLFSDEKVSKVWQENDVLWSKMRKDNQMDIYASALQKKFELEKQKFLEDHDTLLRISRTALLRNTTTITPEGKWNFTSKISEVIEILIA